MIKIGDVIYGFHVNNRMQEKDLPKGWHEYTVTNETKQSWEVGNYRKINKKTMEERIKDFTPIKFVETREEIERIEFVNQRHFIAEMVRNCKDYDKLKKIQEIVQS